MSFSVPEKYRVTTGHHRTTAAAGNNGAFFIPRNGRNVPLKVIASDGAGWEHVSVSLPDRCPSWQEMCRVKDLFWGAEDVVVQFHPARSEYVNMHPHCLHLWRPLEEELPVPNKLMVGL